MWCTCEDVTEELPSPGDWKLFTLKPRLSLSSMSWRGRDPGVELADVFTSKKGKEDPNERSKLQWQNLSGGQWFHAFQICVWFSWISLQIVALVFQAIFVQDERLLLVTLPKLNHHQDNILNFVHSLLTESFHRYMDQSWERYLFNLVPRITARKRRKWSWKRDCYLLSEPDWV